VFWIFLSMVAILGVAALVAAYVVFPRRGEEVPRVPWVGEALQRTVDALPTLGNQGHHHHPHQAEGQHP
jgi:hypothetical protein